jgi:hypothetical protein
MQPRNRLRQNQVTSIDDIYTHTFAKSTLTNLDLLSSRRESRRRETPVGVAIRIVSPPGRERLVGKIDAEHHHRLHQLCSTIESNTKEVIVLPEPCGVVTVHVAHAA